METGGKKGGEIGGFPTGDWGELAEIPFRVKLSWPGGGATEVSFDWPRLGGGGFDLFETSQKSSLFIQILYHII